MAVIPLELIDGFHQGYANISDEGDATYYFDKIKADFILFDNSIKSNQAAQQILKEILFERFRLLAWQQYFVPRFKLSVRLEDYGLCAEDTNLELLMFSVKVFTQPGVTKSNPKETWNSTSKNFS